MSTSRVTLLALCVVEDALHHCQYVGRVPQPSWGLRLALAYLFSIAGDDPGIAAKSREPFDALWKLVAGITPMTGAVDPERSRSTYAWTEYARIRRMVRVPQSLESQALVDQVKCFIQDRR